MRNCHSGYTRRAADREAWTDQAAIIETVLYSRNHKDFNRRFPPIRGGSQ
jgi:hypothetical protein